MYLEFLEVKKNLRSNYEGNNKHEKNKREKLFQPISNSSFTYFKLTILGSIDINPYQANATLNVTHIKTSQWICSGNELTGFYMSVTLA